MKHKKESVRLTKKELYNALLEMHCKVWNISLEEYKKVKNGKVV